MANSWVTSVDLTTDAAGNIQIALAVQVDDFIAGETVEISGQATQEGGAFANYYDIKPVPKPDPDNDDHQIVTVTTQPLPQHQFVQGQAVTVALRVSRVWVTVLGQGVSSEAMSPGSMKWAPPTTVASMDGTIQNW